MPHRRWTDSDLQQAVKTCSSLRKVIAQLGLVEAGGNYVQVQRRIQELELNTSHFTGRGWSKGLKVNRRPNIPLSLILTKSTQFQSFKLKKRLYKEGLKVPACEECGWAKRSEDGRIPLELDHINGDRHDNRLMNLRILCPNCHSLKATHRGKNKNRRGGEIGRRVRLKIGYP